MENSEREIRGASVPQTARRGRPREFDRVGAVDIAMELFWKNGYMQTTLGDLCAAMDIKAPSFYCAFNTREDLFLETVEHYIEKYWKGALDRLMTENNIHLAIKNFLNAAVEIYMRPGLPKGCFLDISTVGLPKKEARIHACLAAEEKKTRELFRKRLMLAIEAGQIPPDSNVPAITGSLIAFLKGIAAVARDDLCQAELKEICSRGLLLLPFQNN